MCVLFLANFPDPNFSKISLNKEWNTEQSKRQRGTLTASSYVAVLMSRKAMPVGRQ